MNSGNKMWKRALNSIPGGNGLLSKRPDRYLPDLWPTYFSRAKGTDIWDIDGKHYVDMAQMGIGTAILGYSNDEINNTVIDAIKGGVNTTLNCQEEVYLAEKLLNLNPFAGGVKFARTGGEAMAIAVRIARAYTGKDKIAFSGYHGWCDWYLSSNLANEENLNGHLLPGLSPKGVPKGLINTTFPFQYNNVDEFEKVIENNNDIGVIVIEGARYDYPEEAFLNAIQKKAQELGIIVILDEITSGWRITDGGVYKINGFKPDIVVYGKSMGNGFAISAVVGKKDIMDIAQETFISSTFWTERVGFVAALKTIELIVQNRVWEHLIQIGTQIGEGWQSIAIKHNIKLSVTDFKPLITMKFDYGPQNAIVSTLFIQEMLKRGYLAANSVYVSYAHGEKDVDNYLGHVDEVFGFISDAIQANQLVEMLDTKVKDEGFKRLT